MKLVGKILLAAAAYVVGTVVMGMIATALHLPSPPVPAGTTEAELVKAMLIAAPILVVGVTPLALGLGGGRLARWGALGLLLYLACGVNTVLEGSIFFAPHGGFQWLLVNYIGPFALMSLALAWTTGRVVQPAGLAKLRAAQWGWRLAAAWVAFPMIYWVFGMCVAPIVLPYYRAGIAGLTIPSAGVIVGMQMLRSPLFLLASLPVIALWTGSRRGLFLSLGLAHATIVGIYGLVQATWFPTVLRVAHSVEITADSFAYAAVLVLLFTASKERAVAPEAVAKAAGA